MNAKELKDKLEEIIKECPDTDIEILVSEKDANAVLRDSYKIQTFDFDIEYEPECLAIVTLKPILYFTGQQKEIFI